MAKAKRKKVGRPALYTPELEDEIVERIANGQTIRTICKDAKMPSERTIYNWFTSKPQFVARLKATVPAQSVNLISGALEAVAPDYDEPLQATQAKNRAEIYLRVFDRLQSGYTTALGHSKSITESQAMLRIYEFLSERLAAGDTLADVVQWLEGQLTERGMLGHESD